MNHDSENGRSTRERLIEAAREVFAEKGFHKATVRDIVGQADANLNAVNYHFGDKMGLYLAIMEGAQLTFDRDNDLATARDVSLAPSRRLHAFIRSFLQQALLKTRQPQIGRLMMMEMHEPTEALDVMVERFIRPRFELLVSIIQAITDGLPREKAELCAESVVGQCLHLMHGQPIISRLMPHLTYTPENIEELASHIAEFSLAALEHLNVESGSPR